MLSNQRGQALLEITIASGLAMLVITAITITTIVGLRNSQFAQNQLLATKYAQEGLELVQTIQARNCPLVSADGSKYYWSGDVASGALVWTHPELNGSYQAQVNNQPGRAPQADDADCRLLASNTNQTIQTKFQRQIQIAISPGLSPKTQVSSIVSWTDYSGSHQSQLVTILSNE